MQGTQRAGEREGETERDRARDAMTCMWLAVHDTQGSLSVSLSLSGLSLYFPLPHSHLDPFPAWVPPPPLSMSSYDKQRQVVLVTVIVPPVNVCANGCVCVSVCVWRNWYKQLPRATIRGFVMQEHVSGRCNCTIKQINYTYKTHTHTQPHPHLDVPNSLTLMYLKSLVK